MFNWKDKLPKVAGEYIFDADLSKLNGFKTGGLADVLFEPKDKEDLQYFLQNKAKDLPIFVIGGGYNLLVRDNGIRGVVISLKKFINQISFSENQIKVGCGILNAKVFVFCKQNEISGYEFLATIPGTIGGAIRMNAGCYGSSISDVLVSLEAIDFDGNLLEFASKDCCFEYRKNNLSNNLIFIQASFVLESKDTEENIEKKYLDFIAKRIATQPHGVRTCGSTFKNPIEMPAWKVIQEIGMQNIEMSGAKMSEKHANFMVNTGTASSKSLEELGEKIVKKAKEEKGIQLDWEVVRVGEK